MPTAVDYAVLLQLIILIELNALTQSQRDTAFGILAANGFFWAKGGTEIGGSAEVNVHSTNQPYHTDGGVLDASGTAAVSRHYNDRNCAANSSKVIQFGCKIAYPNKHRQCFTAGFYTPQKRNIFPKSFASTGAYLPAITACVQHLYLPPQTEADVLKGPYQPPR